MSISLSKGNNVNLTKEIPNLTKVGIALGWRARATSGADFDLDASAFMLNTTGRVRSDADFIFYSQLESSCKSVKHTGDNRTGGSDNDDETIFVDLSKVPTDVQKIVFTVTIHDYKARKQNFGMVSNAFIRLYDQNQIVPIPLMEDIVFKEIARYDLSEEASSVTAMIFGELYRYNGEWKFKAVGQGFDNGLFELAQNFGVDVTE
jgi:tellurium resistance protein TerD